MSDVQQNYLNLANHPAVKCSLNLDDSQLKHQAIPKLLKGLGAVLNHPGINDEIIIQLKAELIVDAKALEHLSQPDPNRTEGKFLIYLFGIFERKEAEVIKKFLTFLCNMRELPITVSAIRRLLQEYFPGCLVPDSSDDAIISTDAVRHDAHAGVIADGQSALKKPSVSVASHPCHIKPSPLEAGPGNQVCIPLNTNPPQLSIVHEYHAKKAAFENNCNETRERRRSSNGEDNLETTVNEYMSPTNGAAVIRKASEIEEEYGSVDNPNAALLQKAGKGHGTEDNIVNGRAIKAEYPDSSNESGYSKDDRNAVNVPQSRFAHNVVMFCYIALILVAVLLSTAKTFKSPFQSIENGGSLITVTVKSFQEYMHTIGNVNGNVPYALNLSLLDDNAWPGGSRLRHPEKLIELYVSGYLGVAALISIIRQAVNIKKLHLNNEKGELCSSENAITESHELQLQKTRLPLEYLGLSHLNKSCNDILHSLYMRVSSNDLHFVHIEHSIIEETTASLLKGLLTDSGSTLHRLEFSNSELQGSFFNFPYDDGISKIYTFVFEFPNSTHASGQADSSLFASLQTLFSKFSFNYQPCGINYCENIFGLQFLRRLRMNITVPKGALNFSLAFIRKIPRLEYLNVFLNYSVCTIKYDEATESSIHHVLDHDVINTFEVSNLAGEIMSNCEVNRAR